MNEMMTFPDTWEEFEKLYGFNDGEEIYTNNSRLIPSFRAKQWLDHLPSVQPKERCVANITLNEEDIERIVAEQVEEIKELLPQKGEWICQADDDIWNCSECDYEIDGTGCIDPLEYLKTYKFCPNCGSYNGGDSDD